MKRLCLCSVEGCNRPAKARGWCRTHYQRWKRDGVADRGPKKQGAKPQHVTCTIEGCDRPHFGRGYCTMHYQRWRRLGSATAPPNKQGSHMARRTHCKHGHEYTTENTLVSRGIRRCRTCARDRAIANKQGYSLSEWYAMKGRTA